MESAALMVRVMVAGAKLPPVSVARNVMLLAPEAVGVPLIAPVEVFSESPAWRAPEGRRTRAVRLSKISCPRISSRFSTPSWSER